MWNMSGAAIWEMASGQLCQEQRVQGKEGEEVSMGRSYVPAWSLFLLVMGRHWGLKDLQSDLLLGDNSSMNSNGGIQG